jgi:hypothetical protein
MASMDRSRCRGLIACVGLLAAMMVGCATDDEPTDDTGATSDAVIAGTETFERPEIGMVWHGSGLCTGTLIRPNVVLTAAHCVSGLPKDADATNLSPPYAFEIRDGRNPSQRFPVVRLHSMLQESDFRDGSQSWRRQDIALMRLASDVPADLARPASVASTWPQVGGGVAIYGYGCTDRTRGANGRRPGSGIKRKVEHAWTLLSSLVLTTGSQNVCPGDSGGPLLDTALGAVLGTNSGYVGAFDHFGDVPANHVALDAIADRWRQ